MQHWNLSFSFSPTSDKTWDCAQNTLNCQHGQQDTQGPHIYFITSCWVLWLSNFISNHGKELQRDLICVLIRCQMHMKPSYWGLFSIWGEIGNRKIASHLGVTLCSLITEPLLLKALVWDHLIIWETNELSILSKKNSRRHQTISLRFLWDLIYKRAKLYLFERF